MPDQEPLPDAPEFIFAGPIDAQAYFDRIGMSWLAAWAGNVAPRLVVVEELCALPQPASQPFTMTDVVSMQTGGDAAVAARQKLAAWVDADLWQANCRYTNDDPADVAAPQDPPPGLPDVFPPAAGDKLLRDLWYWLNWLKEQLVPRDYQSVGAWTVSGTGEVTFPPYDNGEWRVWAAGVKVTIDTKPDWIGRSHSGEPAVFFDVGYFSIGESSFAGEPIRLQREHQVIYGSELHITRFTYNLSPDVEITVQPLYPVTARPIE